MINDIDLHCLPLVSFRPNYTNIVLGYLFGSRISGILVFADFPDKVQDYQVLLSNIQKPGICVFLGPNPSLLCNYTDTFTAPYNEESRILCSFCDMSSRASKWQ